MSKISLFDRSLAGGWDKNRHDYFKMARITRKSLSLLVSVV